MPLLVFTIAYCVIMQLMNVSYGSALGIYLLVFGFLKGFLSHEFSNWYVNTKSNNIIKG